LEFFHGSINTFLPDVLHMSLRYADLLKPLSQITSFYEFNLGAASGNLNCQKVGFI